MQKKRLYIEIKYLYIITLLCVIVFSSFVIIDIMSTFNLLNYAYMYSDNSLSNPFFILLLICYSAILCLFYLTVKGIIVGIKKKLSKIFIFRLPFIILIMIIYFPTVLNNLQAAYWVLIDAVSLGFFVSYLIYTSINE